MTDNAEIEAQTARTTQERSAIRSSNPAGEGRSRVFSEIARDFSGRVAREAGAGTISVATPSDIVGGILTQLIKDAEDQLDKTRATIEWYQAEEQEQMQRLENLQRLQQISQEVEEDAQSEDEG